jgi:hypothetical protein
MDPLEEKSEINNLSAEFFKESWPRAAVEILSRMDAKEK